VSAPILRLPQAAVGVFPDALQGLDAGDADDPVHLEDVVAHAPQEVRSTGVDP
jgi:hypothetical protein